MSIDTGIEWTDATWNPVRGCSRVSEGCRHCYAETVAARFSGPGMPYEGLADRSRSGSKWTGVVRLVEEHLTDPLKWRKPRRVFVNSMSDLFHEALTDAQIDRVFAVMALAPQHTFQVLTKRPERMRDYLTAAMGFSLNRRGRVIGTAWEMLGHRPLHKYKHRGIQNRPWPLPNVWLGVSVENQATADARIPLLLQTPAAVRFISAEPLLEQIDLSSPVLEADCDGYLDWVIVGGESGHGARACDVAWVRSIVQQCKAAGVPAFVKQLGATVHGPHENGVNMTTWRLRDRKGGDMAEWPPDLQVREFPREAAA